MAVETLNRLGLHRARVKAAMACKQVRQAAFGLETKTRHQRHLHDHGYAAIRNFLPDAQFERLRAEAERVSAETRDAQPLPQNDQPGFGSKRHFPGGFDRFDGGTLNRFTTIDSEQHPAMARFARNRDLSRLSRVVTGKRHRSKWVWLYQTLHGDDAKNPDVQKAFHRDTFFSSMKFWFFVRPVTAEDGGFCYVPGSHRATRQRLDWEQAYAEAELAHPRGGRNGSFRIGADTIAGLDCAAPVTLTVPENTLVIADTFGFHRRGDAKPGAERLALYGNLRPQPFSLIGA